MQAISCCFPSSSGSNFFTSITSGIFRRACSISPVSCLPKSPERSSLVESFRNWPQYAASTSPFISFVSGEAELSAVTNKSMLPLYSFSAMSERIAVSVSFGIICDLRLMSALFPLTLLISITSFCPFTVHSDFPYPVIDFIMSLMNI